MFDFILCIDIFKRVCQPDPFLKGLVKQCVSLRVFTGAWVGVFLQDNMHLTCSYLVEKRKRLTNVELGFKR